MVTVNNDADRLFAHYASGRPKNWSCDQRTRDLMRTCKWLEEELRRVGCTQQDQKTQLWKFNRMSRTYDVFEVAAECINEAIAGTIEQGYRPHRRWG